jgi:molybdenum cofactor cytidylyltransferase
MSRRKKRISVILLGAGQSRRMGRDKLVLPWGKKTILERCLEVLLRSEIEEVVIVLSVGGTDLEKRIKNYPSSMRRKIKVILNPDRGRGMSTSIRRGLRSLCSKSEGILIALGDQPLLKTRTVNALIRAFAEGERKIIIPLYHGRRGNPVLFDRWYTKKLMKLRGDTGGRSVIESYPESIIKVQTRSEAVVKDMDTWEEYLRQKRKS